MAKIFKITFLFLVTFALMPFFGLPVRAESSPDSSKLKSVCFEKYQNQFNEKRKSVSARGLKKDEQISESNLEELKTGYREWNQIAVDLLSCYEENLIDFPEYQSRAAELKQAAQKQLEVVDTFDFTKLISAKTITPTISILSGETKVFRLRTFCLDGGRSYPDIGSEYYLAGSVDVLNRDGLCKALQEAQNNPDLSLTQDEVWQNQKFPAKDPVLSEQDNSNRPLIFICLGAALGIFVLGLAIFLAVKSRPGKIIILIIWLGTSLICLSYAGYLYWQSKKNLPEILTGKQQEKIPSNSLLSAKKSGKIIIKVYSTGETTEIDVLISNLSKENLTLDVSCLNFIPIKTDMSFSGSSTSMIAKAYANPGLGDQKLGSSGSLGEGPPLPELTNPDAMFNLMKSYADGLLQDALTQFRENPNEDTLQKVLEQLAFCQQTGCDSEAATEQGIKDIWQKVIEKKIEDYKNNPTTENQEVLIRATEIGQSIGCDTTQATQILGL